MDQKGSERKKHILVVSKTHRLAKDAAIIIITQVRKESIVDTIISGEKTRFVTDTHIWNYISSWALERGARGIRLDKIYLVYPLDLDEVSWYILRPLVESPQDIISISMDDLVEKYLEGGEGNE